MAVRRRFNIFEPGLVGRILRERIIDVANAETGLVKTKRIGDSADFAGNLLQDVDGNWLRSGAVYAA